MRERSCLEQLQGMYEANRHLKALYQQAEIENVYLKSENVRLKEQVELLQSRHFGKRTETGESLKGKGEEEKITVASHFRRRSGKTGKKGLDSSQLPRHVVHHDLAEEEKICGGCSKALHPISQESSEQIEVLPLRLYVIEHIRHKYGCRGCGTIKMASKPLPPIPKASAGGSLLAEILANKYEYHLPLYRQSKMLASKQLWVADNLLGQWVSKIGMGLMKLEEAFFEVLLKAGYLQVDETPVKVLKPEKTGYLWTYFAPHLKVVTFVMSLSRSSEEVEKRLACFKGLLQTDGYQGYAALRERKGIVGLGCLTHARRRFVEIVKISRHREGVAGQFVERVKPLYALEERMREAKLSFHSRKRLRQKIAWPILKDLHTWLKQQRPSVPPKSALGNAINYTLKQWSYLIQYVKHGMAEIDTNGVENQIRAVALGKKNWLFIYHKDSGRYHALFYSLTLTCILNHLNPQLYFNYLISHLHKLRRGLIEPKTLLPHLIDREALQKFADEQIVFAKQILNSS